MARGRVLVLCTGGTIGMIPKDPHDPTSPLVPAPWDRLQELLPAIERLPVHADFEPLNLIDSSDMAPGHWIALARRIGENYRRYDGFVILHGTDTMAYTASALSFMLGNLAKPVVLTGSRHPLRTRRGDAERNLSAALRVAACGASVPEVCIAFAGRLVRGNRARKAFSPSVFLSPCCPELGRIGRDVFVDASVVRPTPRGRLTVHTQIEHGVFALPFHPGISPAHLRHILHAKGLRGVVLLTFGSGNAPRARAIQQAIIDAIRRGIAIVNVTQCFGGRVNMGAYETGAQLQRLTLIDGGDMTPEAAITKLQVVLGMTSSANEIRSLMQSDWCGERAS